jgi:hypothetical protein
MPIDSHEELDPTLPPPGRRWGSGAQSVLPYLTKSLQAKPAAALEQAREAQAAERAAFAHRPSVPPAR